MYSETPSFYCKTRNVGGAIASLLETPSCRVEAGTREEAIEALQILMKC
jgi:hypothetical protein